MNPTPTITPVAKAIIKRLDAGDEIVCVWSGLGCGKSRAVIDAALVLCHTRKTIDQVTGELSPFRILIAAESATKLRQNLMLEAEEVYSKIAGAEFHADPMYPRWQFANGSTVAFRGFKVFPSGKNSIEGQKFGCIFSDETQELPNEWFQVSISRARLPNVNIYNNALVYSGQVVWLGYPQADDRFLREARRRRDEGAKVALLHFRSSSNPWLPRDYEERQKRNYATQEEFEAVCQIKPGLTFPARNSYYGDVVSGMAYADGGSLLDIPLDRSLPTVLSADPGNLSYSVLFWQLHEVDGELKAVVVDEWMPSTSTSDQDAIREILSRGYDLSKMIIDPFASNAAARQADGLSTVQLLQRPIDANPDGRGGGLGIEIVSRLGNRGAVKEGISRTRARLKDVDGNRSILIRKELWDNPNFDRGIRFAVQNYAPDVTTGQPCKKKGSASEAASHCADALRYYVASELWHGPPEITPVPAITIGANPPPRRFKRRI